MELTGREKHALRFIRKKLADSKQATDEQIATHMGCSESSARSLVARLRIKGMIRTYIEAGVRCFDLLDTKPIEPVRVERWTCNGCGGANIGDGGCRNGCGRGRGYLSSAARLPSYLGA